jgi:hypothetical protein
MLKTQPMARLVCAKHLNVPTFVGLATSISHCPTSACTSHGTTLQVPTDDLKLTRQKDYVALQRDSLKLLNCPGQGASL